MTMDSPLVALLADPVVGAAITFVASMVAFLMGRLRPGDRSWWDEAREWPGQAVLAVTFIPGLAGALPRLVWEPGHFVCDPLPCRVVDSGQRVIEGTGAGAFFGQFALSAIIDIPAGLVGAAIGGGIATLILSSRGTSKPPQQP